MIIVGSLLGSVQARADSPALSLFKQARGEFAQAAFPQALTLLQRARKQVDPRAHAGLAARIELELGMVLAVLGRKAEAKKAFASALSFDPTVNLALPSLS